MRDHLKFICVLSVIFIVFGCEAGSDISSYEYTTRAKSYLDNGELQEASIELKNALRKDTNNAEARLLFGQLHLTIGEGGAAEIQFKKAQNLGVGLVNIQSELARALLIQGKNQQVLELAILQDWSPQKKGELLALRGVALLGQKQPDAAMVEFNKALTEDESATEALIGLARINAIQGNIEQARRRLDKALTIDAREAKAWELLGYIEYLEGDIQAAIQAFTNAAENRVANKDDLVNRAALYVEVKQFENAEDDIKQLRNSYDNFASLDYIEGLLYFQQQHFTDAQNAFEKVLAVDRNHPPALFYAGAAHFMQGNKEQAIRYLSEFNAGNSGYLPALKILATIHLQNGNHSEAERIIRLVIEQDAQDPFALNLLASALMRGDNVTEGLEFFQKVVALQPDFALARINLGQGLIQEGDLTQGIAELEIAQELEPESEDIPVKIVIAYLRNKSYDEALKAALDYSKNKPESAPAHALLGRVYMARGENSNAGKAFAHALDLDPGNIAANNALAAIALKSRQLEKAKEHYKSALNEHPGHLRTLMNLALIDGLQKNYDEMEATLQQATALNPQSLEPRLVLSMYYRRSGEYERVLSLLHDFRSTHDNNTDMLLLLGESELMTNAYKKAMVDLTRLVELAPDNAKARFLLAQTYAGQNDTNNYQNKYYAELKKVLELDENHLEARVALVRLLLEEKNTKEAKIHIDLLKQQVGDLPGILLLEGKNAALAGDIQVALTAYQKAYQKQQNNFNLLRLESMEWAVGNRDAAVKLLETWMGEYPEDHLVLLQLASRYYTLGEKNKATTTYLKVLKLSPENVLALNDVAWLLRETEPVQAVLYAEKAFSIEPDSTDVIDTLAMVLSKSNSDRARKLIGKAVRKSPDNPTIRYHQAIILRDAGINDEAFIVVQSLLEKYRQFPEREEASQLLKDLEGS